MRADAAAVATATAVGAAAVLLAFALAYRFGVHMGRRRAERIAAAPPAGEAAEPPPRRAPRDPGLPRTPKRGTMSVNQRAGTLLRRMLGWHVSASRMGVPLAPPSASDVEVGAYDAAIDGYDEARTARAEDILLREMQTGDVGRLSLALREAITHNVRDEYVWAARVLVERLTSAFLGLDATKLSAKKAAAATLGGYYAQGEDGAGERLGSPGLFLNADADADAAGAAAPAPEDGSPSGEAPPHPAPPPPPRSSHGTLRKRRNTLEDRVGVRVGDFKPAHGAEAEEAMALVLDLGTQATHARAEGDRSGYQPVTRRALSRATGPGVEASWCELRMPGGHTRYYNTITGAISAERPVHLEEGGASTKAKQLESARAEVEESRRNARRLEELLQEERLKFAVLERSHTEPRASPRKPTPKEYVVPWGIIAACISDNFADIFRPPRLARDVRAWTNVPPILRKICAELQRNLHTSVYFALPTDPPLLGRDMRGKLRYVAATETDNFLVGRVLPEKMCLVTYEAARSRQKVVIDDVFASAKSVYIWRHALAAENADENITQGMRATPAGRAASESPEIILRAASRLHASPDILEIGGRHTSLSVLNDRERLAAMAELTADQGTEAGDEFEVDGESFFERPRSARITGSRGFSAEGKPLSAYATGSFGAFPITLGGGPEDPACGVLCVDTLQRVEANELSDEETGLLEAIAKAVGQVLRYAWERERILLISELDSTLAALGTPLPGDDDMEAELDEAEALDGRKPPQANKPPSTWHDCVAERVALERIRQRVEGFFPKGAVNLKRMLTTLRVKIETPINTLRVMASVMLILGADGVYDALMTSRHAAEQLTDVYSDVYDRFLPSDPEILRVLWRHHVLDSFDKAHEQMPNRLGQVRMVPTESQQKFFRLAERMLMDTDPSDLVEPTGLMLYLYYWCRILVRLRKIDGRQRDNNVATGATALKFSEFEKMVNQKYTKKVQRILERADANRAKMANEAKVRRSREEREAAAAAAAAAEAEGALPPATA